MADPTPTPPPPPSPSGSATPTAPITSAPPPAPYTDTGADSAGVPVDSQQRGELTTGTPTTVADPDDKPTRDDPKAAWLEYARARGYDRGDDDITKDQLIADYGA